MRIDSLEGRTTENTSHEDAIAELNRIQQLPTLEEARARAIIAQHCGRLSREGQHELARQILAAFDAFSVAASRNGRADSEARGYERCTADVVAWLDRKGWPERIAEAIEDGVHVGAAGGNDV